MSDLSIKLCGVRDVRDARLCAEAGADELGVVFAKTSKRRLSLAQAREVRESLPPAPRLVGVFQDATLDELQIAANAGILSALQLHGALPAGLFEAPLGLPLHLALQITDADSLAQLDELHPSLIARVLLDGPRGGSGKTFAWRLVREARKRFAGPIHLAGGLTPENVAEAVAVAAPDGVDVSSGIEGPDGRKDPERIRAFVEGARAAIANI
jgi:phosphoribosylanthranilate isomerase